MKKLFALVLLALAFSSCVPSVWVAGNDPNKGIHRRIGHTWSLNR